jgi:hypothetical protein
VSYNRSSENDPNRSYRQRDLRNADHRVARDQRGQLLFGHSFGTGRTLGQNEITQFRGAVPDAHVDIFRHLAATSSYRRSRGSSAAWHLAKQIELPHGDVTVDGPDANGRSPITDSTARSDVSSWRSTRRNDSGGSPAGDGAADAAGDHSASVHQELAL